MKVTINLPILIDSDDYLDYPIHEFLNKETRIQDKVKMKTLEENNGRKWTMFYVGKLSDPENKNKRQAFMLIIHERMEQRFK
jgi:hypothetical protein